MATTQRTCRKLPDGSYEFSNGRDVAPVLKRGRDWFVVVGGVSHMLPKRATFVHAELVLNLAGF